MRLNWSRPTTDERHTDAVQSDPAGVPQSPPPEIPEPARARNKALTVREMTVFSMLGALMYCSKLLMEWAPNIHFLALFLISFTVVYRKKALIPLYIFVFLTGLLNGFNVWWVPYLYIWLPLFFAVLLLPRNLPVKASVPVYMLLGALHGLLYGTLYAPAQALFFHMDFKMTLAWIAAGLPWDALHAAGNLAACTLVVPLSKLLNRLEKSTALPRRQRRK